MNMCKDIFTDDQIIHLKEQALLENGNTGYFMGMGMEMGIGMVMVMETLGWDHHLMLL